MKIYSRAVTGGTYVVHDFLAIPPVQFIVGTPGRIFDMMKRAYIKTDHIKMIILDEFEELLSRGFEGTIR